MFARARGIVAAVAVAVILPALAPAVSLGAEFAVSSPEDAVDAAVGDGECSAAEGVCTLRAAIQEANASSGPSTITLPAGRFALAIAPIPQAGSAADKEASNGDLDLNADIALRGAGVGRTIIDGDGIDRVIETGTGASIEISDVTITGGDWTANNSQEIDLGGGIQNKSALVLDRVELVGNKADGGGGMFSIPRTMPVIRDSLIHDNEAFAGGGLRIDSGATIINTTITRNRLRKPDPDEITDKPVGVVIPVVDEISGYGGGIDHRGGALLEIINSTIADNHAIKGGGGLGAGQAYTPVSEEVPLGSVALRNTIIAGNTSVAGAQDCRTNQVPFESLGHNLDGDGSCFLTGPQDRAERDPLLARLADNGGPTRTLALRAGSPAIDAGGAEGCPAADARGIARPQGAACDIGAFERVPKVACAGSVRLPKALRKRARSFDVVAGRRVLVRRARPSRRVRVRRAAGTRVRVRVRLRSGRKVRRTVRVVCRRS